MRSPKDQAQRRGRSVSVRITNCERPPAFACNTEPGAAESEIVGNQDHDWKHCGQDRGNILVDVFECQTCGCGKQVAVADDPETPEEDRDWTACLLPGETTWDDECCEPDCPPNIGLGDTRDALSDMATI